MPTLALAAPLVPAQVLLPSHYAEGLGVGLAAVGGVLALMRFSDVATDPLIGWLSDHWPSARLPGLLAGRRKPFIAAGNAGGCGRARPDALRARPLLERGAHIA